MLNIVLVRPEIPQNTGTIGRLCVSCDVKLHLVKPLGFSLEDKYVRRAGMDYWKFLDLKVYENWEDFARQNPENSNSGRWFFFSTKGTKSYWDERYRDGDYLIFGSESCGLPLEFYDKFRDKLRIIPMKGKFYRSLNLANAASIVLYEALRQQAMPEQGEGLKNNASGIE